MECLSYWFVSIHVHPLVCFHIGWITARLNTGIIGITFQVLQHSKREDLKENMHQCCTVSHRRGSAGFTLSLFQSLIPHLPLFLRGRFQGKSGLYCMDTPLLSPAHHGN